MPKVFQYESFSRRYKKFIGLHPEMKKKIRDKLELFEHNPYAPALRLHKLTGKLADLYAISIDYDTRVVIDPDFDHDTFYLVDIGPHDEVY